MAWQQWQRSAFVRVREPFAHKGENGLAVRFQRTRANGRERSPGLDKVGVTGSSPVPPIRCCRIDNML